MEGEINREGQRKRQNDNTRELGQCGERKRHDGQKKETKKWEEMTVKSRGIFQN